MAPLSANIVSDEVGNFVLVLMMSRWLPFNVSLAPKTISIYFIQSFEMDDSSLMSLISREPVFVIVSRTKPPWTKRNIQEELSVLTMSKAMQLKCVIIAQQFEYVELSI